MGDNNSVRRSGRRAYELPVMTCPPSLPSSFRDQLPCAPISIGGVVRKRRCIHTAVYLVDGGTEGGFGRTKDGHRFDGVTDDATSHVNVSPCLLPPSVRPYLTLYRVIYETRVLFLVLPLLIVLPPERRLIIRADSKCLSCLWLTASQGQSERGRGKRA